MHLVVRPRKQCECNRTDFEVAVPHSVYELFCWLQPFVLMFNVSVHDFTTSDDSAIDDRLFRNLSCSMPRKLSLAREFGKPIITTKLSKPNALSILAAYSSLLVTVILRSPIFQYPMGVHMC
jgi:hypothetical protein